MSVHPDNSMEGPTPWGKLEGGNQVSSQPRQRLDIKMDFNKIFDGKDTENLLYKWGLATKWTTRYAATIYIMDVLVMERRGLVMLTKRAMIYFPTAWAVGLAYVGGAAMASYLRNREDELNHFWAGVAGGCAWGGSRKKFLPGFVSGLFLVAFGMAYKIHKLQGREMFPEVGTPRISSFPTQHGFNYNKYFPLHERNWVPAPAEEWQKYKRVP